MRNCVLLVWLVKREQKRLTDRSGFSFSYCVSCSMHFLVFSDRCSNAVDGIMTIRCGGDGGSRLPVLFCVTSIMGSPACYRLPTKNIFPSSRRMIERALSS